MSPAKYIKRITLFKVPKEEDVDAAIQKYKTLRETAVKDGEPYILHNEAGKTINTSEERSKGFTLCGQTTFASQADVDYYDSQCGAHAEFKKFITPRRTDVMVVHVPTEVLP
ncbi:hypothetical protein LTR64_001484 [Lithohypha guttulata]|nr:hypothetical protein LTR51_003678 [Lithohypha guttulata]